MGKTRKLFETSGSALAERHEPAEPLPEKGAVLIAEAESVHADRICSLMEEFDCEVAWIAEGKGALDYARHHEPMLVVANADLPGLSGLELCSKLRSARETVHIPVVLLSRDPAFGEKLTALRITADDYLSGPLDLFELRSRLRPLLKRAQTPEENRLTPERFVKPEPARFEPLSEERYAPPVFPTPPLTEPEPPVPPVAVPVRSAPVARLSVKGLPSMLEPAAVPAERPPPVDEAAEPGPEAPSPTPPLLQQPPKPALSRREPTQDTSFENVVLPNGLRVVKIDMPHIHSVVVTMYVRVGPRLEGAERNGISHFLEHMMFKGTKQYSDSLAISAAVDSIGAELNGATLPEYSEYVLSVHTKHLERGLQALSEVLLSSSVTEKHIEQEKRIILEEMGQHRDVAGMGANLDELSYELMWPGQSHSFRCIGTEEIVAGMTRDELLSHYHRFYVPQNMVMCVSGNFQRTGIDDLFGELFGQFTGHADFEETKIVDRQVTPRCLFKKSRVRMAYMKLCHKACSYRDPDLLSVLAATDVLGGGVSSRLFTAVRERLGLVYDISSSPTLFSDIGSVDVFTSSSKGNLVKTVRAILDEIDRLVQDGITPEELKTIKDRVGCHMEQMLDSPIELADWFGIRELLTHPAKVCTPEEEVMKLRELQPEDLLTVFRDLFVPEKRSLVVTGSYGWRQKRQIMEMLTT